MANGWHRKKRGPADAARTKQYNSATHRAGRKAGQALVDSGQGSCWRCGRPIPPGTAWHLGHDDHDRSVYRGVECVPCSLRTAASRGAQIVNARRLGSTQLRW